jgi:hypothetical protein
LADKEKNLTAVAPARRIARADHEKMSHFSYAAQSIDGLRLVLRARRRQR